MSRTLLPRCPVLSSKTGIICGEVAWHRQPPLLKTSVNGRAPLNPKAWGFHFADRGRQTRAPRTSGETDADEARDKLVVAAGGGQARTNRGHGNRRNCRVYSDLRRRGPDTGEVVDAPIERQALPTRGVVSRAGQESRRVRAIRRVL